MGLGNRTRKKGFYLANPFFAYAFVWLTTLWLTSLQLTDFLNTLNAKTITLVFSNIASFGFVFVLLSHRSKKKRPPIRRIIHIGDIEVLNNFILKLVLIWISGTIFEILISGGVPLLWLLAANRARDYRHFGIPVFHGMMNALHLLSLVGTFLVYNIKREKKTLVLFIGLLGWTILVFSRGLLFLSLLEILGIYLLIEKMSLSKILKVVALFLLVLIIFGVMGDFRVGVDKPLDKTVFIHIKKDAYEVFNRLPRGIYWAYLYTTIGINNVNAVVENLQPTYAFSQSIAQLVPSVLREQFVRSEGYALPLVVKGFTASTYYAGFLADFGMIGSIMIVIILQFIIVLFYKLAIRGNVWAMLAYAALFQSLVLSVFWDTFTSLPIVAQIFFALYLKRISRLHRKNAFAAKSS